MTLEFKDKDQLVQEAINSILTKIPDIDFSDGEPLKTFIDAVMQELSYQYWQLQQVYDNSFIDTSYGDDLSKLVNLLGITRNPAVNATGKVKFYRQTAATLDYLIPAGTIVETLPNANNIVYSYQTTENVTLLTGQLYVYANIKATNSGLSSNVTLNKITIINNPPLGIESVINDEAIVGGEDEETDDNLKIRAKSILETSGQGTVAAIENKIKNIAGIKSVSVLDMQRGIGTLDILVLGDVIPLPSDKMTEVQNTANSTKAGGIDISIYEPTYSTINLDITLTLANGYVLSDVNAAVNDSINSYLSTLGIGDSFIKNQLIKYILDSTVGKVTDITINTPSSNVSVGSTSIATLGTVTLH